MFDDRETRMIAAAVVVALLGLALAVVPGIIAYNVSPHDSPLVHSAQPWLVGAGLILVILGGAIYFYSKMLEAPAEFQRWAMPSFIIGLTCILLAVVIMWLCATDPRIMYTHPTFKEVIGVFGYILLLIGAWSLYKAWHALEGEYFDRRTWQCPHCSKQVTPPLPGRAIPCPHCGKDIKL